MSKFDVQAYYQQAEQSGSSYLNRRFTSPGGKLVSELELKPFRRWIQLGKGHRMLDVGSGTGRVISTLCLDVRNQVTALDSSEPMLTHLHEQYPEVNTRLADLFTYEPDGLFDVVTALRVLDHFSLEEQQAMLMRWKAVLKPGGRIIVGVVVRPSLESLANRFLPYRGMTYFHSRRAYARMFHRCELQVTRRHAVFLLLRGIYYRLPETLARTLLALDVAMGRVMPRLCSSMTCELTPG